MSYSDASVALLDAIRHDEEAMLCQILGSCPQASAYTSLTAHGGTPIHVAVEHRSSAVLPRLLLVPGSPNMQDLDGNTPMHCLFREPCWWREEKLLAMAQELLGRTDVNIRNHLGESPFDIAVTQFRPSGMQGSLERAAANVSLCLAAAADDNSPLGVVMATIVDRLVGSKTLYSSVQPEGWRRATECLCALLEVGARPDSPLGGMPVLSYLLSHPAAETEAFGRLYEFTHRLAGLVDAAAPDSRGLTALDYAISMRPQEQPGTVAQQRQVIQELTEQCCRFTEQRHGTRRPSASTTSPSSLTAFATHWSADEGFLELSMRLVAAGADTSAIITTQYRDTFSVNLKYLLSVSQSHDDEQARRGPYGLEPHARLDSLQSALAPGVPLGAAIWISACDVDSWDTARERMLFSSCFLLQPLLVLLFFLLLVTGLALGLRENFFPFLATCACYFLVTLSAPFFFWSGREATLQAISFEYFLPISLVLAILGASYPIQSTYLGSISPDKQHYGRGTFEPPQPKSFYLTLKPNFPCDNLDLRALEELMPKPPCSTHRLCDEALRLLSTKFLDGWTRTLRASASPYYASPDAGTRQAAQQYLSVLALCAGRGEHARPEKRYYDLVGELAVFCSPATGGCHSGYARA